MTRFDCFLVDVHCPLESDLEVSIDTSTLSQDEVESLISELKRLGLRVKANRRTQRLRFSPFPTSVEAELKNMRGDIYARLIPEYCFALRDKGGGPYLLPRSVAASFLKAVEEKCREHLTKLREKVESFRHGDDYMRVAECLNSYGIDSSILDKAGSEISDEIVDLIPVDFNHSLKEGNKLLRSYIEKFYRDCQAGILRGVRERILELSKDFDEAGKLKKWPAKMNCLKMICSSLGMGELVEGFLEPAIRLFKLRKHKRLKVLMETFGTSSLREAAEKFLESKEAFLGGQK